MQRDRVVLAANRTEFDHRHESAALRDLKARVSHLEELNQQLKEGAALERAERTLEVDLVLSDLLAARRKIRRTETAVATALLGSLERREAELGAIETGIERALTELSSAADPLSSAAAALRALKSAVGGRREDIVAERVAQSVVAREAEANSGVDCDQSLQRDRREDRDAAREAALDETLGNDPSSSSLSAALLSLRNQRDSALRAAEMIEADAARELARNSREADLKQQALEARIAELEEQWKKIPLETIFPPRATEASYDLENIVATLSTKLRTAQMENLQLTHLLHAREQDIVQLMGK